MTKNQKLVIGISSSFLVIILVTLSLVSSAKPSNFNLKLISNSTPSLNSGASCNEGSDFWKFDPSLNEWASVTSFGGGNRESAVAFSIGDKGYVGTGRQNGISKKDFWERNGDTGAWTQLEDFGGVNGTARHSAIGFSIGNKGYIGTGIDANGSVSDFWEYDPFLVGSGSKWTRKADFAGGVRSSAIGFSINNKGYIGTGYSDTGRTKDFWEWDGDINSATYNTWIKKADYDGGETANAVGFSIWNKGYIGTGSDINGSSKKDFWEWDGDINSATYNTWIKKADFGGVPRFSAAGFSTLGEGKGYIGTGSTGPTHTKDFWEYDPVTNLWTQKENYAGGPTAGAVAFSYRNYGFIGTGVHCIEEPPITCTPNTWTKKADFGGGGLAYATGFSIGTKGYIGTGTQTNDTKMFWEYDQNTDVWTQKADFGGFPRNRAVGFSIGSKGYIGTGTSGPGNAFGFNDFWEWDQATNTWNQKANLVGLPRFSAVGFSVGDKGYITTGGAGGTIFLNDLWEYDPVSDVWTQRSDFGGVQRLSAAGFSLEGIGYVGTGLPNNLFGGPVKDFWAYNPVADSWKKIADLGGVARHEAAGFSINTKGYIGTGQGDGGFLVDFWAYNSATNTWVRKANYGGGQKANGVGFSIGQKGYIGTGPFTSNSFWEYCPD